MILIVDDESENIFSLKKLLEFNKFEVDTASSGEEAVKKILQNSYALIMLDVQMPGMDGFEVAELISRDNKNADLPIIFLSAVTIEKDFILKGYASGGIDYITKPLDPEILLLKVKTFYRLSEKARNLNTTHIKLQKENEFRKKAEDELNNRLGELLSLIEAIPHIAFMIRANGSIEFVNHLWYSYSQHGKVFPESHQQDPSIESCWKIASMQEDRYSAEIRIKNIESDEFRYHLLIITPIKIADNIVKWVGTLTDINKQKTVSSDLEERVNERTKELQEMNSQLESSNVNLQRFASIASHDLKEPLRKIETFSSIIRDKYLSDDATGVTYIDRIVYSSKRMTRLIDNLLNYSTVSVAEVFECISIKKIVEGVIIDLDHVIQEKNAVLQVHPQHEIEMIPGQMKQVFHNILSNALKFTKTGTTPVITINSDLVAEKSIDGEISESGDFCRIMVKDNGIGFDEKYLDRIFDVFQRLNSRSKYEGTGIGLAIVQKIICKHHGIVSATSKENEGACFIIVLPIKQKH